MSLKNHPLTKEDAPDPAAAYERAKPEKEAGMGRLDNNLGTPTARPDVMAKASGNKQIPEHQLNAEDIVDSAASKKLGRA